MTIWSDALDDIYGSEIAVTASLAPGSGGAALNVRIVDKTGGIEVSAQDGNGEVLSIRPAAYLRMSELDSNSLTRNDLADGTLTIAGKAWLIRAHALRPNPDGELKGEACLFLEDADL